MIGGEIEHNTPRGVVVLALLLPPWRRLALSRISHHNMAQAAVRSAARAEPGRERNGRMTGITTPGPLQNRANISAIPLRATSMPDEHAERKDLNWCTEYVQLVPGLFEGGLFDINSQGVTIGLENYNLPMEEMFCAPPGKFFYVRGTVENGAFCEGQALEREFGLICAEDIMLNFLARSAYSGFYVAIDDDQIDLLLADFDWRADLRRRRWALVPPPSRAMLDRAVLRFLRQLQHEPGARMLAGMMEDVMLAAASLLPSHDECQSRSPSLDTRAYIFRKARDYILDRIDGEIGVAEICQSLRVSQRTLEYSFIDATDLTPKRYILTHRLNRVRSDIVRSRGALDVIEIAHWRGFNHPSRFAEQYRRHFLELPSDTKRRQSSVFTTHDSPRILPRSG